MIKLFICTNVSHLFIEVQVFKSVARKADEIKHTIPFPTSTTVYGTQLCVDAHYCKELDIDSNMCNTYQSVREKCKKSCGICEDEEKCRRFENIALMCKFIPEIRKRCPNRCKSYENKIS